VARHAQVNGFLVCLLQTFVCRPQGVCWVQDSEEDRQTPVIVMSELPQN
jgi:hypothetical protein